jgi:hypothetical protein
MNNPEQAKIIDALVNGLDFKLSKNERAQLMAIASRNALFWAAIVTACWYLLWFSVTNDEPAWAGLVFFVTVFTLVFYFKRKALLRRVELTWAETLKRNELDKLRTNLHNQAN